MMWWPFQRRAAPQKVTVEDLVGFAPSKAGAVVTPETALTLPAVSAAVRIISESLASLPLHVYRRGEDNARDRDASHPAHVLLHDQANPWTSAVELRQQITADALLTGNGYGLIIRARGRPRELHRLAPATVSVDLTGTEPTYKVSRSNTVTDYSWRDILHVRAPLSHDGVTGLNPVRLAREAIGVGLALEGHAAALFGNGARPSGVIQHPAKMSPEAHASLQSSWNEAHTGKSAGGTAILEEGASWNPLTFNSVDAQFLESRKYQVDEIARAFGVPPVLLFELGRATWGNSEELRQNFLTFGLLPWVRRWEGAIARSLLAGSTTHFAEFNLDGFLRADFAKRAEGYSKLISARVLNPNEARAMEGRPPYAGGEAFENPNVTTGAATGAEA